MSFADLVVDFCNYSLINAKGNLFRFVPFANLIFFSTKSMLCLIFFYGCCGEKGSFMKCHLLSNLVLLQCPGMWSILLVPI